MYTSWPGLITVSTLPGVAVVKLDALRASLCCFAAATAYARRYRSVITSPLRSAARISPTWRPDTVSTAPF